jgi:hypothetical protein
MSARTTGEFGETRHARLSSSRFLAKDPLHNSSKRIAAAPNLLFGRE